MTDLELTIMAMLSETERYGYEIDKLAVNKGIRHRGGFARSSIYAVLNRLMKRGLVTSREIIQSGRPPRKLFALTYSGRNELESSLAEALKPLDRILGNVDLLLRVWPLIAHNRKTELLNIYNDWLMIRQKELSRLIADEVNPINAAFFQRPLSLVEAEANWLRDFSERNGLDLSKKLE